MKTLPFIQGSPEWIAARTQYFTASEAPAMLGLSKYQTRGDLLKQKATGIVPDVDSAIQRIFDRGHEIEALARPIVEARLGEELYTITATDDASRLLASFDGITMLGDTIWENKSMNQSFLDFINSTGDIPDTHWPQVEQQLLISCANKAYFTLSDGTEAGTVGIWYESQPDRRKRLISGWEQFEKDLAEYRHIEIKPDAVADVIEDLPALTVQLVGQVTASNLSTFQAVVLERIKAINTTLVTDSDFATADKMVKFLDDGEKRLELVKSQALAQTSSIDELFRTIDSLKAEMKAKRLTLDKLVKAEKENRKSEIVSEARRAFIEHCVSLTERVGVRVEPQINFGEAIKGLKSLDSMRDKTSSALANAKIEANSIADRIDANRKTVEDMSLFPDFSQVCTKAPDDFAALLAMRLNQRNETEERRLAADRERIRAEEQEKAQREAKDVQNQTAKTTAIIAPHVQNMVGTNAAVKNSSTSESNATINLGEICSRLGFNVTADFLISLGFIPSATEKNAKLYSEENFPAICHRISDHVLGLAMKQAA